MDATSAILNGWERPRTWPTKLFLLDTGYAGIDGENFYCRLDFMEEPAEWAGADTHLVAALETLPPGGTDVQAAYRLEAGIAGGQLRSWSFARNGSPGESPQAIEVGLQSLFECRVPLSLLEAPFGSTIRVRFSLWRDRLPLDALPQEGAIEVRVLPEPELAALAYAKP
jgi:hypothetical protein